MTIFLILMASVHPISLRIPAYAAGASPMTKPLSLISKMRNWRLWFRAIDLDDQNDGAQFRFAFDIAQHDQGGEQPGRY